MFVAHWEPENLPDKPDLTSAHIWIKLLNVPFQLFNEDGLQRIACLVGNPNYLHPSTTNSQIHVVWFKNMVPKHAFNFWVANLNRLPLNEHLHQWGLIDSGLCTICSTDQESRDHLFLNCRFAADVWDRVKQKFGSPLIRITSWNDLIEWLLSRTGSSRQRYLSKTVCQTAVYFIWKDRNDRKHGRPPSTSIVIFNKIDRTTKDTLLARRHNKGCRNLLFLWFSYS